MRLLDQRAGWPPAAAASLTAQALRCISGDAARRPSFLELASLLQDLAKTTREAATSETSPAGGASVAASVASVAGGASVEVASVASPRVESSRQLDDGGAARCRAVSPQRHAGDKGIGAKAQTARAAHDPAPGGGSSVSARVAQDAAPGGGCSVSYRGMPIQLQGMASAETYQDFKAVAAPPPPPAGRLRYSQAVACSAAQAGSARTTLQQHTGRSPTPPRASFVPPLLQPANASGMQPAAAAAAAARGAAVRAAYIEPQRPLGASGSAPPGAGLQQWQQPVAPQRRVAAFPDAGAQLAALPQRVAAGCPGLQLSAGIGGPALVRGVACGQLAPIANAPVMPAVRVPRAVYGR